MTTSVQVRPLADSLHDTVERDGKAATGFGYSSGELYTVRWDASSLVCSYRSSLPAFRTNAGRRARALFHVLGKPCALSKTTAHSSYLERHCAG